MDASLVDVPMNVYPFTWFKSLGTNREVEEKLDRALVNHVSCILFPKAEVKCLIVTTSNHYPILLCCEASRMSHRTCDKLKFENMWLIEPGFNEFFLLINGIKLIRIIL